MNSKSIRADDDFIKEMRKIIPRRIQNFPEDAKHGILTDRELTRMIKNTEGFKIALEELETLPRRIM